MLAIRQKAAAGTMESSDAFVEIEPAEEGLHIQLESVVLQQFGEKIRACAQEVLQQYDVQNASVRIFDRGALDCVIRARVETAILRGKGD